MLFIRESSLMLVRTFHQGSVRSGEKLDIFVILIFHQQHDDRQNLQMNGISLNEEKEELYPGKQHKTNLGTSSNKMKSLIHSGLRQAAFGRQ
jgi:hypothetical protein